MIRFLIETLDNVGVFILHNPAAALMLLSFFALFLFVWFTDPIARGKGPQ